MHIYLVGGAVRDRLLGLPVRERDWVVTQATPDDMLARGFRPKDRDAPVFEHPETGEEYALARRERKQGQGHKGFAFDAGPDVTLEEDLARRDLTVNAMAEDPQGRIIDPWQGRADLERRRLRHVTPAFREDPLRVLRLARFAAQLARFGFEVDADTEQLAIRMSEAPELGTLSAARVWRELDKALRSDQPTRFVRCLARFGALGRLMPWLEPPSPASRALPEQRLARAEARSDDPEVRLAVLLTAAARAGAGGLPPQDWPLPAAARALAGLCRDLPPPEDPDPHAVLRWLEATDAWRRSSRFEQALAVWEALEPAQGEHLARLRRARDAARGVRPEAGSRDPAAAVRAARLARVRAALRAEGPAP